MHGHFAETATLEALPADRVALFFLCAAAADIILLLNILFYDKSKDE
jgi:hypothetical protein